MMSDYLFNVNIPRLKIFSTGFDYERVRFNGCICSACCNVRSGMIIYKDIK